MFMKAILLPKMHTHTLWFVTLSQNYVPFHCVTLIETPPKQPVAKSPRSGATKKQQRSTAASKPRGTATGRGRPKAAAPSKVVEDVRAQASDEELEEELEEVTALTLTKPGGRKRKPTFKKQQNASSSKPISKRAKVMSEGDSGTVESSSSKETDEGLNEEDSKGVEGHTRTTKASPMGGVSTRRRGGRKRKVQERQEEEEVDEQEMEKNKVRGCVKRKVIVCGCYCMCG